MSLNDGHLFVTPEQIQEEFQRALQLIIDVYEDFNLTEYRFRLSLQTLKILTSTLITMRCGKMPKLCFVQPSDEMGVDYFEAEGEAASTDQNWIFKLRLPLVKKKPFLLSSLTLLLPERFDLKYIGADGEGTPSSHDSPWSYLNYGTLHSYLN